MITILYLLRGIGMLIACSSAGLIGLAVATRTASGLEVVMIALLALAVSGLSLFVACGDIIERREKDRDWRQSGRA